MNKHVEDTRDQICNTLQTLSRHGLTRIIKDVYSSSDKDIEILTWDNHVPGRHNAGSAFTTLTQYISIYKTGAYHCLLFDGSIIRAYFKFRKNILLQESLLYWPAPVNIPEDEIDELGISEALDLYFSDAKTNKKSIVMRSPIRFDFDSSNVNELHPETHVHLQHSECRISAKKPICFNTFIRFILENFYSDTNPPILKNMLKDLRPLNYSGYSIYEKAVICL